MIIDMGNSNSGTDLYFGWQQKPGVNFNYQQVFFTNLSGQPKEVCDVSQGMVIDTTELRTGWQCGETNKWQFNPSYSKMQPRPGDTWKKGLSVPVAIGQGKVALWMASGATAWDCLAYLGQQLAQCPQPGHVPLVMHEGNAEGRYEARTWVYPLLKVQSWMPRPESLSTRTAIDMGNEAPPPQVMPSPPSPALAANLTAPVAAPVAPPVAAPVAAPVAPPVANGAAPVTPPAPPAPEPASGTTYF